MLLFEKYGQHQPLNRQAERFAREGVALSTSTLADHVVVWKSADALVLAPMARTVREHCSAVHERLRRC